jgi:phosphate-selective porin OprO/OprP
MRQHETRGRIHRTPHRTTWAGGVGSSWLVASAIALGGVLPGWAADVGVEDRLRAIEAQLDSLKKENADLKAQLKDSSKAIAKPAEPGSTVKLPATVMAKGKESKITIGGLIQTQLEVGDVPDSRFSENDRFLVRRARLGVAGSFLENFSWKLEGDFGNASLKNNSSYRALATDIYIQWNRYDFANVRVGQFKTLFGHEQLESASARLFAERAMATDQFTISRQVGASVTGDFYEDRLAYGVAAFNGPAQNNGFNDNEKFTYTGRLSGTPWKGKIGELESRWSLGINAYASKDSNVSVSGLDFDSVPGGSVDNIFQGDRRVWAADTQFELGRFEFRGEYFRAYYKALNQLPSAKLDAGGFHLTLAAYVLPRKVQALVRYESLDLDLDSSGNSSDAWVFGVNYYIKGNDLKLQLNYHLGSADGAEDHQGRLIARAQLMF